MINWNEAPEGAMRYYDDHAFWKWVKMVDGVVFLHDSFEWREHADQSKGLEWWKKATPRPDESKSLTKEMVKNPTHYDIIDDFTTLEMIARSSTVEEFRGFCKGNIIKYRMRVGKKDDVTQEVGKADNYKLIYEDNKHLCYDYLASNS